MEQKLFAERLAKLRTDKGISARDMSLSLGQSDSYINKIENGTSFPSMTVFFYICEYLEISEKEFFDVETKSPSKSLELYNESKQLNDDQLNALIAHVKSIKK